MRFKTLAFSFAKLHSNIYTGKVKGYENNFEISKFFVCLFSNVLVNNQAISRMAMIKLLQKGNLMLVDSQFRANFLHISVWHFICTCQKLAKELALIISVLTSFKRCRCGIGP